MQSTLRVLKRTLYSFHHPLPIQMILSIGRQAGSCCRPRVCVCASPLLAFRYYGQNLTAPTSYTFCIGIASAAIYSVLEPIANDTGLTLGDLNAGTGYMVRACPHPPDGAKAQRLVAVSTFRMGLLVLAASCAAIWKAARLLDIDTGNNGE